MITAKLGGLDLEVVGDKPNNMPNWLWDFEARPISEDDKDNLKSYERISTVSYTHLTLPTSR